MLGKFYFLTRKKNWRLAKHSFEIVMKQDAEKDLVS